MVDGKLFQKFGPGWRWWENEEMTGTQKPCRKLVLGGLSPWMEKPLSLKHLLYRVDQWSRVIAYNWTRMWVYYILVNKEAEFWSFSCIKEADLLYLNRSSLCKGSVFRQKLSRERKLWSHSQCHTWTRREAFFHLPPILTPPRCYNSKHKCAKKRDTQFYIRNSD